MYSLEKAAVIITMKKVLESYAEIEKLKNVRLYGSSRIDQLAEERRLEEEKEAKLERKIDKRREQDIDDFIDNRDEDKNLVKQMKKVKIDREKELNAKFNDDGESEDSVAGEGKFDGAILKQL